eukprot:g4492.t1
MSDPTNSSFEVGQKVLINSKKHKSWLSATIIEVDEEVGEAQVQYDDHDTKKWLRSKDYGRKWKHVEDAKAETEVDAKVTEEVDAKAKAEADAQSKAEAGAQSKAEADAKAKTEAEAKAEIQSDTDTKDSRTVD